MSIGGLPALNDGNNARARPLRPPDRAVQRPDVHLGRQQTARASNTIGDPAVATKVMSVGAYITKATWQSELRLRLARSPTTCTPSARAARARTAASSRRSSRRARRSRRSRSGSTAGPSPARTRCRPATHVQRHLDGLAAGGRRGGAAGQRRQAGRCAEAARPAARRRSSRGAAARYDRYRRVRAGQRPDQRRRGVGPAEDQPQDGRHHLVGAGQHGARPASSRRPASARASTTARASTPGRATRGRTPSPAPRAAAAPITYNLSLGRQRRHVQLAQRTIALPKNVPAHARRSRSTRPPPGSTRRSCASTTRPRPGSSTRR